MGELDVLGKRNKWRTVFPPARTIKAVKKFTSGIAVSNFTFGLTAIPLLSPLNAPETKRAIQKHRNKDGELTDQGFSVDGINKIVKAALKRIAEDESIDLEDWERQHLLKSKRLTPSGIRSGLRQLPEKFPRRRAKALGHSSLQTTTIYVQANNAASLNLAIFSDEKTRK